MSQSWPRGEHHPKTQTRGAEQSRVSRHSGPLNSQKKPAKLEIPRKKRRTKGLKEEEEEDQKSVALSIYPSPEGSFFEGFTGKAMHQTHFWMGSLKRGPCRGRRSLAEARSSDILALFVWSTNQSKATVRACASFPFRFKGLALAVCEIAIGGGYTAKGGGTDTASFAIGEGF